MAALLCQQLDRTLNCQLWLDNLDAYPIFVRFAACFLFHFYGIPAVNNWFTYLNALDQKTQGRAFKVPEMEGVTLWVYLV
eukprot:scaffold41718_cov18-Tisochrysis_lutea.AAC.1